MTELSIQQRNTLANALAEADSRDRNADGSANRTNMLAVFNDLQYSTRDVRVREIAQMVTNMLYDSSRSAFSVNANQIRVATTPRDMLGSFARVIGTDASLYTPPTAAYERS